MPNPDCVHLREELKHNADVKLGFVIYRLTYQNNAEWDRFMVHLQDLAVKNLKESCDKDLIAHIAWEVVENPGLENVTMSKVRSHFKKRLRERGIDFQTTTTPRYMACMAVGQIHIETCMEDLDATERNHLERCFVEMVSTFSDEGYQSVLLSVVLPRVYSALTGGWDMIQRRRDSIYEG